MAKETLSLLFLLFATTCALQCYHYASVTCGEHSAFYDATCNSLEGMNTETESTTSECDEGLDKCAKGETAYSLGDLDVNFRYAFCATGNVGCDSEQQDLSGSDVGAFLSAISGFGLTSDSNELCICEGDTCNSAFVTVGHMSVLLFGVFLALFV